MKERQWQTAQTRSQLSGSLQSIGKENFNKYINKTKKCYVINNKKTWEARGLVFEGLAREDLRG